MLNLAGSVVSKGGQNPADVREQASSPTWLKVAEDETASQPRACRETSLNKLRNFLEVIIYLDNKPCAGPAADTELTAFTDGCPGLRSILVNAGVTAPPYLDWFRAT
jgi:hypothetical protein